MTTIGISVMAGQVTWPNNSVALPYSTTDYTEEGAKKSFEFVLKDYLDYAVENGTLEQDLMNHGWLYKANCN